MPHFKHRQTQPNIVGDLRQINFSIDDFKGIREEDMLYVDKSKLIEDIMTYDRRKVVLFTRPRRFGKSLNLSMLRYFFDRKEDSRELFHGLYIENSEVFLPHLNQYPVLFLNFKDVSTGSKSSVEESIVYAVENVLESLYKAYGIEELKEIPLQSKDGSVNIQGMKKITQVLSEHTNRKVVVLVDEYDSLLNQTYGTPLWKDVADLAKKIFGALLKSNEYLYMGILTGVSRIGKELGFSDLNNLSVYGLTNEFYYEHYGLTEAEVKELFHQNQIQMTEEVYRVYNGYHIDETSNMFNTTSILKLLDHYNKTGKVSLSPYWINSSVNSILKDNIRKMNVDFRNKLLGLLDGGTITEGIFENVNFDSLDKPAHMLSLLIDTGHLCPIRKMGGNLFEIKIPNEEVLYGYQDMVNSIVGTDGEVLEGLCGSLMNGNVEDFEARLNKVLLQVSSFNDFNERENSYHCLMEGALLYMLGRFRIRSNREAGLGRFDIALIPTELFKKKYRPILIEFKVAKEKLKTKEYNEEELLGLARKALDQIKTRKYYCEYADEYSKEDFLFLGIGAQGKRCRVSQG